MRAVLSLPARVCCVLVCCAPLAFAVDTPPSSPTNVPVPPTSIQPKAGHLLLQLSPMYAEIRDSLAISDTRQKQLLVDLAAATDTQTADAIVHQLECLPLERVLTILRIQLRYARQENKVELEREIRLRMIELEAAGNI